MKQNAGILFHGGAMEIGARSPHDREGRRKYLSRQEGQRFLERVVLLPTPRALFCLTLYYTGCRISEALSLRWCDLDFEMKVLLIRSLKKRSRKEIRRVPIPDFLVEAIKSVAPSSRLEDRMWVFSRTSGWRIIKRVMREAAISGVHATSKGLRHGFGVRGALGQVPLSQIQRWMGHADATTTAIYLAVQDDEERVLIEKTW